MFVIAVILRKSVHHEHEISLIKDARPNQEVGFVRYNLEFVITEFYCIVEIKQYSAVFHAK